MPVTVAPIAVTRILRTAAADPVRLRELREEAEVPASERGRWSVELLYRAWTIALREASRRRELELPLPLELARTSTLDEWGIIGLVARTAPTAADAIRAAASCHRLVADRGVFAIESDDRALYMWWRTPNPSCEAEAASDLATLAYFACGMRELLGSIHIAELELRAPPPPLRERHALQRFFGADVRFGASKDAITIDARTLAETPPQAHLGLFQYLLADAAAKVAQLGPASWTARVDRVLAESPVEIDEAARALATSPRTLQRRLREEGTSFRARREDALSRAAAASLSRAGSIGEVSDALGFSDQSAFARAHKRWFGTTPRARRRDQR